MLTPHAWGEDMWGCCFHTAMYLFYQDTGAVGGASSKGMTQTAWTSLGTVLIKNNLLACNQVAGGGDAKANGAACFDRTNFGRCSECSTCCSAAPDQATKRPRPSRRPRCTLQIIAATRTGRRDSWMGNFCHECLQWWHWSSSRSTSPPATSNTTTAWFLSTETLPNTGIAMISK